MINDKRFHGCVSIDKATLECEVQVVHALCSPFAIFVARNASLAAKAFHSFSHLRARVSDLMGTLRVSRAQACLNNFFVYTHLSMRHLRRTSELRLELISKVALGKFKIGLEDTS